MWWCITEADLWFSFRVPMSHGLLTSCILLNLSIVESLCIYFKVTDFLHNRFIPVTLLHTSVGNSLKFYKSTYITSFIFKWVFIVSLFAAAPDFWMTVYICICSDVLFVALCWCMPNYNHNSYSCGYNQVDIGMQLKHDML